MTINDFVGRLETGVREIVVDSSVEDAKGYFVQFGYLMVHPNLFNTLEPDKNPKRRIRYVS